MPENTNYMIAGYAIAWFIIAFSIASIYWRYRAAERDEELINRLENEDD